MQPLWIYNESDTDVEIPPEEVDSDHNTTISQQTPNDRLEANVEQYPQRLRYRPDYFRELYEE